MTRRPALGLSALAVGLVVLLAAAVPASGQSVVDPNLVLTPYATGLTLPTQIRFIGEDELFVSEKNSGIVKHYVDGVYAGDVLDLDVANNSERGLLGLELHPDFATNGWVYAYYSATSDADDGGTWTDNRLARYVWNGTTLSADATFTPITFGTSSDGQDNGPNHDAGPIVFGPDGKLYGTTGDLNRDAAEQNVQAASNTSAHAGGIYRLNDDGSIPNDNPFLGETNADFHRWFGYGVRNTFGIAFDPLTGQLWETENGPSEYDEINLIESGFNGGWLQIMGPDSRDAQDVDDLVALDGSAYSDPEFSFLSPVAVTGIAFLADTLMDDDYRDAVLVGANNTGALYLFRLNATRDGFVLGGDLADLVADSTAERSMLLFGSDFGAITDLQVGPDGALYITSIGDGIIYRLAPIPEPASAAGALALLAIHTLRRKR